MNIVKVISSDINKSLQRIVKFLRMGLDDVQTANQLSSPGIDAAPIPDQIAAYSTTTLKGKPVIIGYVQVDQEAEPGEINIYSQDASNGAELNYIFLTKEGTIEIGGDTDNMVRFSELQSAFDELKEDFNNLVTAYNAHIHITTATVGPSPTPGIIAPTASTGTPSAADISGAEIEEILTS